MKQVQDHYFRKAKQAGYVARSAFKLEEVDRKHGLLRAGMRVLELGCAPGSWTQYTAKKVGPKGDVVAVDLLPLNVALPTWVRILQGDAFDLQAGPLLAESQPFDLLLSDMAPKTTGIPSGDAARSAALVERCLELAVELLRPGGALLAKAFQGREFETLRADFRERFAQVSIEKPKASRSESVEVFLLGQDFRGTLVGTKAQHLATHGEGTP